MPMNRHVAVVFRVAAGPRVGFGHLLRCRALARALGVEPRVSVRGTAATRRAATALGLTVIDGGPTLLDRERPDVLVVDDPSATAAGVWVSAARRRGTPVATIHDAGLARLDADLVIDGSVRVAARVTTRGRFGPRFAVLDPAVTALRASARPRREHILVAVGGGAHVRHLVPPVVAALARRLPHADIRVAPGFTPGRRPALASGTWLAPADLATTLADARVAIVAGGLTAYEACALGVPVVAVSVVQAQQPTVRALARHGAAVDGGALGTADAGRRVSAAAARLLREPSRQQRLSMAGRRLIDGRGAARVATALRRLAQQGGRRG